MSQMTHVNPWLSMWTHPRETIRGIVQAHPSYGVFWLSTIYILQSFFFFMNYWSLGLSNSVHSLLIYALALAPFIGLFWVRLYGWVLRWVGKKLGGEAPVSHLKAALAWSRLPMSIALIMWFFLLIANPDYVFIQYAGSPSVVFLTFILLILEIWTFILFLQTIREIQHFSLLRALANIFLAGAAVSVCLFVIMLIGRFFLVFEF